MVGPYVARGSVDLAALRSCINVSASDWSVFRSGPSWISAQMRPHYRTASNGTRVRMRREVTPLVENRPGDAGELVGERDRHHVVVQPLLGGGEPCFDLAA